MKNKETCVTIWGKDDKFVSAFYLPDKNQFCVLAEGDTMVRVEFANDEQRRSLALSLIRSATAILEAEPKGEKGTVNTDKMVVIEGTDEVNTCAAEMILAAYQSMVTFVMGHFSGESLDEFRELVRSQVAEMKATELPDLTDLANQRLKETAQWFAE
jgi:hypothetical protein